VFDIVITIRFGVVVLIVGSFLFSEDWISDLTKISKHNLQNMIFTNLILMSPFGIRKIPRLQAITLV